MPTFVHLVSASRASRIRRNGISRTRRRGDGPGVFAVPVTRNFYLSHQWLRELKRRSRRTFAAVYFRVADEATVCMSDEDSDSAAVRILPVLDLDSSAVPFGTGRARVGSAETVGTDEVELPDPPQRCAPKPWPSLSASGPRWRFLPSA